MTIQEMALRMWPCWALGLVMLYLLKNSREANLLRVDGKGLLRFATFLLGVTAIRFVLLRLAPPEIRASTLQMAKFLPWQATLGVFWEDMCHTVPLVILARMFVKRKWFRFIYPVLFGIVMFAFGSGHVYQGAFAAIALSFYIPFTIRLGKKYGFGTVMLCHMSYDLVTLLSLRWICS